MCIAGGCGAPRSLPAALCAAMLLACGGGGDGARARCGEAATVVEVGAARGGEGLAAALRGAPPGTCVVLERGVYEGAFDIPPGVAIVGPDEHRAPAGRGLSRDAGRSAAALEERGIIVINGRAADRAAVRFLPGRGAALAGVAVTGAASGIEATGALDVRIEHVRIADTEGAGAIFWNSMISCKNLIIERTRRVGLAFVCDEGAACRDATLPSRIEDLFVGDVAGTGVYVHGQALALEAGEVAGARYTGQAGTGWGVVAAAGAALVLRGTRVTGAGAGGAADGVGVVADGPATRLRLLGAKIVDNEGRGVWVQGLRGALRQGDEALVMAAAALYAARDDAHGDTEIAGNVRSGLGAIDSRGIIVINGRIRDTRAVETALVSGTEQVGDGLGLFDGTGDVRVEGLELAANARAQVLGDGNRGIIVINGRVTSDVGEYGVVFQNRGGDLDLRQDVNVPAGLAREPQGILGVHAPRLGVSAPLAGVP